jgi:Ca2+-binding RTX toxin-like protein
MRLVKCAGLIAVLIITAAVDGAGLASASTVAIDGSVLRYVAAAGEQNQLTITPSDESTLQVVDLGASIEAGNGCRQVDVHQVQCTGEDGGDLYNIEVEAGDMDDAVTLSVPSGIAGLLVEELGLNANGGAGDDVLRLADALSDRPRTWSALNGGIGDDRLWGGTGDDRLDGGGGRDELYGGRGTDRLTDGDKDGALDETAPGPDLLDGGSGASTRQSSLPEADSVSYSERTNSVSVDLRRELPNGEEGEDDRIVRVEGVGGGQGNDTLHGSELSGGLFGGPGDDVIIGDAGDQEIGGDAGDDRLTGGSGDDWVHAGSGDDRVWGGPGHDLISGGNGRDRLSGDAGRDELDGENGVDRVLGGSGHDSVTGGTGEDVLRCGSDTDDVIEPRRDLLPASCERIAFYNHGGVDEGLEIRTTVATHLSWRPWPWPALRIGCPWWTSGGSDDARRHVGPAGELVVKARRVGRPLLARARFSDAALTCATGHSGGLLVRARLTKIGQRLASRQKGVLATLWLRVRVVIPEEPGEGAHFRAAWTTHLSRPD